VCLQQFFVHPSVASVFIIGDGLRFSQRCGGVDGLRVTTRCWECLRLHPFCPGSRHSPCLARHAWYDTAPYLGRGVIATIVESCCVLYLMV